MSKITSLTEAMELDGGEQVVLVKGGTTRRGAIGALVGAAVVPHVANAQASATRSELAAAQALTASPIYPDVAAGLAAVAEGSTFSVQGTGDDFAILYRKVGGAEAEVGRFPSAVFHQAYPDAPARTIHDARRDIVAQGDSGAATINSAATNNDAFGGQAFFTGRLVAYARNQADDGFEINSLPLSSATKVADIKLESTHSLSVRLPSGTKDVLLDNVRLLTNNDYSFFHGTPGLIDTRIARSTIHNELGYAVASDDGADSASGFWVTDSRIYSGTGDAILWNHPGVTAENYFARDCLLTAADGAGSDAAGFAFSVANTKSWTATGLQVTYSRQEAFHIEDGQRRGILGAVSGKGLQKDGIHILHTLPSQGESRGAVLYASQLLHEGPKAGFNGVHLVWDDNGTSPLNLVDLHCVEGFDVGIALGGGELQAEGVNVALHCNVGRSLALRSLALGTIYAKDTPVLHQAMAGTIGGQAVSDGPAQILEKIGVEAGGAALTGFAFKGLPFSFAASGYSSCTICDLPTRMAGRIILNATAHPDAFFFSADIKWDGAALSVSNAISYGAGAMSDPTLLVDAGQLKLQTYNGAASPRNGLFNAHFTGAFFLA